MLVLVSVLRNLDDSLHIVSSKCYKNEGNSPA